MGMSHRDRLNTLVNILENQVDIFGEFEGKVIEEDIFLMEM